MQGEGGDAGTVARRRSARAIVIAAALVSAIVVAVIGAASGVSPTGTRSTDIFAILVLVAVVGWCAASAPWWLLVPVGIGATVFAGASGWAVAGLVAAVLGGALRATRRVVPWASVVAMALAMLSMLHGRISPFFGASALITGAVTVIVIAICLSRRTRKVRLIAIGGLAALGVLTLLAVAGLVVGALRTRTELENGYQHVDDGLAALRDGKTSTAASNLREAAADLRRANARLGSLLTQPSRLVPVAAQHRTALHQILTTAIVSASAAADALEKADIDQLQVSKGTIDVAALAALAQPLADLDHAVAQMGATIKAANSPWLVGAAQARLADATRKIDDARAQARATEAAAVSGPGMLGGSGRRSYLVVFTSPKIARAQSGTPSYWAEITFDNGHVEQTTAGTIDMLIDDLSKAPALHLSEPQSYFDLYGAAGAGSSTSAVKPSFWKAVTMSPDTPTVAAVMAQMYTAAGHGAIDGVLIIDPAGVTSMLTATGPVAVPGVTQPVTADQLAQFLVADQTTGATSDPVQQQALQAVAGLTLRQFLTGTLPAPRELGHDLGPAATQGHIVGWARRPVEEEVFRLIGMAGQLPQLAGTDGLSVVTNNLGGNEIDGLLERRIDYSATYDPSGGQISAQLTVTLVNNAPATGLSDAVIGNALGLPPGTNRTSLTVYSPLTVDEATIDGTRVTTLLAAEQGWKTSSMQFDIGPGQQRVIHLKLSGVIAARTYSLVWKPQPVATPDAVAISVRSADGASEAKAVAAALTRLVVIDRRGVHPIR